MQSPIGNYFDKYQTCHPLERWAVRRFLDAILAALDDPGEGRVLDVGCGEGVVTGMIRQAFPRANVMGLDHGHALLALVRPELARVGLVAGSAYELPFPDDAFDLVVATETLEHLEDPAAALREIARVGRGRVLLTVPLEPHWRVLNCLRGRYLKDRGNTPGHLQHWSRRDFGRFLATRLELDRLRVVFPWILAAGRVRQR